MLAIVLLITNSSSITDNPPCRGKMLCDRLLSLHKNTHYRREVLFHDNRKIYQIVTCINECLAYSCSGRNRQRNIFALMTGTHAVIVQLFFQTIIFCNNLTNNTDRLLTPMQENEYILMESNCSLN